MRSGLESNSLSLEGNYQGEEMGLTKFRQSRIVSMITLQERMTS